MIATRRLGVFVAFLLLGSVVGCKGGSRTTQHTLSSGRIIKVIAVGPLISNSGRALVLSYQTDLNIDDREGLRREAVDIWGDFRADVEKAGVNSAIIKSNEAPRGLIFTTHKSFGFAFERKPDTGWSEVGARLDGAVIGQYGRFEMINSVARIATSGKVHAMRQMPKWIEVTQKIPRAKGTFFGYEFVVQGQPAGSLVEVKTVVEHPPFQAPGSSTRETWTQPVLLGKPNLSAYGFDHDWEMVAGTWAVRVYHGSHLLCEKQFTVE